MKPRIGFEKIWFDEHIIELKIEVCDGESLFVNEVYVGNDQLGELCHELLALKNQIPLGKSDISLGDFGPKSASGGFHAHVRFQTPGNLLVSTHQESEFGKFFSEEGAAEAKMFLRSEPILLDQFISELESLDSGTSSSAVMHCVPRNDTELD